MMPILVKSDDVREVEERPMCDFKIGSNKVAIELRVVQFWPEIILVISNHAYDFRPLKLDSVQLPSVVNLLVVQNFFSNSLTIDI